MEKDRRERVAGSSKVNKRKRCRVTAEGYAWEVIGPRIRRGELSLSVRQIAVLTGLSIGSVQRSYAWSLYQMLQVQEQAAARELLLARGRRLDCA